MVSIKGLDKAKVLKALYDNSHVQGLGIMHAAPEGTVTEDRCRELLEKNTAYDYLYGRVMKVDLAGDEFDERLYDRGCGEGAAQRAVDSISQEPESEKHQAQEDEKPKEEAGQKDGEAKKEKSTAEKAESVKKAVGGILDILTELPPDECFAAAMYLKHFVLGPLTTARLPLSPLEPRRLDYSAMFW